MKHLICLFICILLTACHKKEYTEVESRQPDNTNFIYIPVSINGKKGDFLFDTGATRSYFYADWAEGLGIEITDYPVSDAFMGTERHDYYQNQKDNGVHGDLGIWFVCRFSTMYIDLFAQEVEFAIS